MKSKFNIKTLLLSSLIISALPLAGPAMASAARARHSAVDTTAIPTAVAVPVTATSRPFLGAKAVMEAAGYVEEEYFLTGKAKVYDWQVKGHTVHPIAGPGKYVTRILVRRPRDPAKFGGNVEVTVLNASLNLDFGGPSDFASMIKQGDVWIGITTKAVTANALKSFDSVRYAPLDWSSPVPPAQRCDHPTMIPPYMIGSKEAVAAMLKSGMAGSWPHYEDGMVWDMLGQLGLLLKSDQRSAILPGFSKPYVYMTGVSQSSIYIRTFVSGFHDLYRTADGSPVYDGYLGIVGPAMIRINQCSADIPLEDPAQKLIVPDVPFISISSEGEMWQARHTHQRDAFTRKGGMVSYEVAGASHRAMDVPGLAPDKITLAPITDMMKAGFKMPAGSDTAKLLPKGTQENDFIWQPLVRGAFHNLELWARQGIRPPQAPGISIGRDHEIRRDSDGNAIGGLRMPYIDAPLAAHQGYLTAGGMGGVRGAKRPFSTDRLKALYPDQPSYVAKFSAATDHLLAGRWILPEDAAAMKAAAAKTVIAP